MSENSPKFALEDFSLGVHDGFWTAYTLYKQGDKDEDEIRRALPVIETRLTMKYGNTENLGLLSEFNINLNVGVRRHLLFCNTILSMG